MDALSTFEKTDALSAFGSPPETAAAATTTEKLRPTVKSSADEATETSEYTSRSFVLRKDMIFFDNVPMYLSQMVIVASNLIGLCISMSTRSQLQLVNSWSRRVHLLRFSRASFSCRGSLGIAFAGRAAGTTSIEYCPIYRPHAALGVRHYSLSRLFAAPLPWDYLF
jgi:hypothetical protein